eukprot:TRINITY_DN4555_c0_g1_i1.p1 TRINITY_DN4555_c0_g1~~TRINITY_DN4555_c0_g1_i1.p1  ORF type:complete len:328 (+),score=60.10 TRINITY_DN4555_c0_g1_i1:84-1067(+)
MVDINLEAVDGDSLPKDLYLSLRVGEQQKFSKANNSGRTFKFAQPEDKRYGKLEIYRRVGVAAISLDTEKYQEAHELTVPVDDERVSGKEVKYRFCLGGNGSLPTSPKGSVDPAKQVSAKVNVARDYLQKHQLEQRLSEAMQAVLREQPEDPGAFLAQRLTSGAGIVKKAEEPLKMMQNTQASQVAQSGSNAAPPSQPPAQASSAPGASVLPTAAAPEPVATPAPAQSALPVATPAPAQSVPVAAPVAVPVAAPVAAPAPVPAVAPAPAPVSWMPAMDMEVKLDLPMPRDYPMPTMADKDPISTATLMIGPGMCSYANIGRPGIMIF